MINASDHLNDLHISDYNYSLPEKQIAQYPLSERDQSKMLLYRDKEITEKKFTNLPEIIQPGNLLVFNNTRVIPARLNFKKSTGASIEIFCLEPIDPSNYQQSFQSHRCVWKCMVGNLKKWKDEALVKSIEILGNPVDLKAQKVKNQDEILYIEFSWNSEKYTFSEIIEAAGVTPIPPYLNRNSELIDKERYQTIYSKIKGSVAAPTAGLHFTDSILGRLTDKGVLTDEVTLHVGAGTFKPVQAESISEHEMHTEFFSVSKNTIKTLLDNSGKIISVGTTTLRVLESLYWMAIKIKSSKGYDNENIEIGQWDAYTLNGQMSYSEAMQILLEYLDKHTLNYLYSNTQILIAPGYKIRSIEALITNFHQPKSTLLLLVSAITGPDWKKIYDYALSHEFRFLSYGDSSIIYVPH